MKKIAILGGGNMGEAFIKGLKGNTLFVCEQDSKRAKYLKETYKVQAAPISEAVLVSSVIILAVKPQDMADVLHQIVGAISNRPFKQLFISIAAGLTTQFFEKHLGGQPKVIRCMPNMPALIGEGITGICAGKYAKPADVKQAQTVLGAVGQTVIVKESMMDAVTAVSGSGPAYVFLFVEQWVAAARTLGFNEKEAKSLVYETLVGSAHLLKKANFSASELRLKVTSKGGTTQAAMDVFFKGKFDQLMKKALLAAENRSKQLAK